MPDIPTAVKFYYEKAYGFRVIHVDGVIGGITPSGDIFVALYNQRAALPKEIDQSLTPDGKLGDELQRAGKKGIFREMEVGCRLTAAAAKDMADWLLRQAKILEESTREPQSPESQQRTQ